MLRSEWVVFLLLCVSGWFFGTEHSPWLAEQSCSRSSEDTTHEELTTLTGVVVGFV